MAGEEEVSESTVKYRVRAHIIWYLECASSSSAQRAYERNLLEAKAPGIVPAEMIEQWADLVVTRGSDHRDVDIDWYSEPEFSPDEQAAILQFHTKWDVAARNMPKPTPWTIEDLIDTPVWQQLMDGADNALQAFLKRGHLLSLAQFPPGAGEE